MELSIKATTIPGTYDCDYKGIKVMYMYADKSLFKRVVVPTLAGVKMGIFEEADALVMVDNLFCTAKEFAKNVIKKHITREKNKAKMVKLERRASSLRDLCLDFPTAANLAKSAKAERNLVNGGQTLGFSSNRGI